MEEYAPEICVPVYQEIVFYTSYVFAFISRVGMIFVLKESLKKERKKTMLNSNLISIAFAEIINCISKLSYLVNQIYRNKTFKEYPWYFILTMFQIIMTIFSEFCTLFASMMMSYKIYESTRNNHIFLKRKYTVKILIILSYVIPFFLACFYSLADHFFFYYEGGEQFYFEECKIWNWMSRYLSFSYYILVIIIVFFISYFSCKTISFLKKKKEELKIKEEEDNTPTKGEEINKGTEVKDELSERITAIIKKIQYFPIVTIVVWSIFIFDRVPDDIGLMISGSLDNPWFLQGNWKYFKRATILLHNFTATIRGLIYCLTFFRADNKLFEDISNFTAYVFCCNCCKKNNNIDEKVGKYQKMTIGMENVPEDQENQKFEE